MGGILNVNIFLLEGLNFTTLIYIFKVYCIYTVSKAEYIYGAYEKYSATNLPAGRQGYQGTMGSQNESLLSCLSAFSHSDHFVGGEEKLFYKNHLPRLSIISGPHLKNFS